MNKLRSARFAPKHATLLGNRQTRSRFKKTLKTLCKVLRHDPDSSEEPAGHSAKRGLLRAALRNAYLSQRKICALAYHPTRSEVLAKSSEISDAAWFFKSTTES